MEMFKTPFHVDLTQEEKEAGLTVDSIKKELAWDHEEEIARLKGYMKQYSTFEDFFEYHKPDILIKFGGAKEMSEISYIYVRELFRALYKSHIK